MEELKSFDGKVLRYRLYRGNNNNNTNVVLVIVPGFGEHSGLYDELAQACVDAHGWSVLAYDQRGFGMSDDFKLNNARGSMNPKDTDELAKDLSEIVRHVVNLFTPDVPRGGSSANDTTGASTYDSSADITVTDVATSTDTADASAAVVSFTIDTGGERTGDELISDAAEIATTGEDGATNATAEEASDTTAATGDATATTADTSATTGGELTDSELITAAATTHFPVASTGGEVVGCELTGVANTGDAGDTTPDSPRSSTRSDRCTSDDASATGAGASVADIALHSQEPPSSGSQPRVYLFGHSLGAGSVLSYCSLLEKESRELVAGVVVTGISGDLPFPLNWRWARMLVKVLNMIKPNMNLGEIDPADMTTNKAHITRMQHDKLFNDCKKFKVQYLHACLVGHALEKSRAKATRARTKSTNEKEVAHPHMLVINGNKDKFTKPVGFHKAVKKFDCDDLEWDLLPDHAHNVMHESGGHGIQRMLDWIQARVDGNGVTDANTLMQSTHEDAGNVTRQAAFACTSC